VRRSMWFVVAALVALAALAVAGCGSGGGKSGTKSVYANYPGQEFPYYQAIRAGEAARAKQLGWKFEADFANDAPDQQVSQIQTALARQPTGMLISPVTAASVVPAVQQAHNQKVPVVAVANDITDPSLLLSFTGTANATIGRLKAQYIVTALHGRGVVATIHGVRGRPFSDEQAAAATAVFQQNPGIRVIDGGYAGGFSSDVALNKTQTLLTRAGHVDAIYFDNDDQALGGIQALQARNQHGVVVVGSDGTPAGLAAVKAGQLAYTISLCGYTQGVDAMNILADAIDHGTKPPARVQAKYKEVTASVLADPAAYSLLRAQRCE